MPRGVDIVEPAQERAKRDGCGVAVDVAAAGRGDLVSKDGRSGLVVAGIAGGEKEAPAARAGARRRGVASRCCPITAA